MKELSAVGLSQRRNPMLLGFKTTDEVNEISGLIGQRVRYSLSACHRVWRIEILICSLSVPVASDATMPSTSQLIAKSLTFRSGAHCKLMAVSGRDLTFACNLGSRPSGSTRTLVWLLLQCAVRKQR